MAVGFPQHGAPCLGTRATRGCSSRSGDQREFALVPEFEERVLAGIELETKPPVTRDIDAGLADARTIELRGLRVERGRQVEPQLFAIGTDKINAVLLGLFCLFEGIIVAFI